MYWVSLLLYTCIFFKLRIKWGYFFGPLVATFGLIVVTCNWIFIQFVNWFSYKKTGKWNNCCEKSKKCMENWKLFIAYLLSAFRISKKKSWFTEQCKIRECVLAHKWIIIVVRLRVIYFWYSECMCIYTYYYIDFTLFLSVLLRHFKRELIFYFRMLNNIFNYDDVGTVKSGSEIKK